MLSLLKKKREWLVLSLAVLQLFGGGMLILMGNARRLPFNKHMALPEYLSGAILVSAATFLMYRVLFHESGQNNDSSDQ